MNILLTGASGQLGLSLREVLPRLGEVVPCDHATLDIADEAAVERVISEVQPAVIVNAAAYTEVDRAESEQAAAERVNAAGPEILAKAAKRIGALLVHYSTDYVFDGTATKPYRETDPVNPINVYGRTKLQGEERVAASGCNFLILRTSWLYGPRRKNFFTTIATRLQSGQALRVVADQVGIPTEVSYLAEQTERLIGARELGVFHVAPAGVTTWHGFATAIAGAIGAQATITGIQTSEYPTAARRPKYSVLDTAKVCARLGIQPPRWEVLLERCASEWARGRPSL